MQDRNELNRLIDQYLNGKATPEETIRLNNWFEQLHTPGAEQTGDRQELGQRIFTAVQAQLEIPVVSGLVAEVAPRRISRMMRWRIAASVISAALVAGGGWWYQSVIKTRKPVARMLDLRTLGGQLTKITLTDSSVVWLNANSHLRYPEAFTDDRTVYLQGEAYFNIHPDPGHPFIIESGGYRTRVLGTAFSIRAYAAPQIYKVTVASGKVAVFKSADSSRIAYLTADQELRINEDAGTQQVRAVHAQTKMSWKNGSLTFEKDFLSEVAISLQNRYGVIFSFKKAQLKNMEISGIFDHSQSLDDILKILNKVYGLHFNRQANGMIIIS
ncbi:FecR family protein [Chitinophaga qingshengii]|uniref:FecR domain-containing protein n=1 Tax=Chitinophaga qingshengii TaxID=1569794 RepID=A0ABR7TJW2_9BACT|nr:FecR domain-containing protein [Chitinophaga qingshengii]MBC9929787.1 FecR domain-containing protein [Chitinophaga qingshengii]